MYLSGHTSPLYDYVILRDSSLFQLLALGKEAAQLPILTLHEELWLSKINL